MLEEVLQPKSRWTITQTTRTRNTACKNRVKHTSDDLVCAVARSHKNSKHGGHHESKQADSTTVKTVRPLNLLQGDHRESNRADCTTAKTVRPLNLLHSRNVIDGTDSNKSNVSTLEVCDDIESSELKVSNQLVNNSQDDNHDREGNWYEMLPETSIDVESMDHTICDKDFEAGYNHKVQESSYSSNQQFPLSETYYTTTDYRALLSNLMALSATDYPSLSSNTAFVTPGYSAASLSMAPGYRDSTSTAVFTDFKTISFDTTSFEAPSFNTAFTAADYEMPSSDTMFMTTDYQAPSSSTVYTTTGYQDPSSNNAITATGCRASSLEEVFVTPDYPPSSNRVFASTDCPAQSPDTVFIHADYPAPLSKEEVTTDYGTSSLDTMFTTSGCPVPSPNTESTTIDNQAPLSGISSVVTTSYEAPSVDMSDFTVPDNGAPDTIFMMDCAAPSFDPLIIAETNDDYGAVSRDTVSATADHQGSLSQLESHGTSISPDMTNVQDSSVSVIHCPGVPTLGDQAPPSVSGGRISPVYSDISDSIDEAPLYAKTADTVFSSGPSSLIDDMNMMLYHRDVTTESQPSHVASDQRIQNWCANSQATTLAKFSETAMNPLTFPLQTPQDASFPAYRTVYFQRIQTEHGSYYTPLTYPSISNCNKLSNSTNSDPNKSSDATSQK